MRMDKTGRWEFFWNNVKTWKRMRGVYYGKEVRNLQYIDKKSGALYP